ncbi:MAG: TPM domain-containing protein [Prochlorococcaceae cyanobacterium ETNP2_MAG_10]|nr:TPM domain-containing protein [Prochlorococcaceae cyanobacterium ETNP2_MAG_10]
MSFLRPIGIFAYLISILLGLTLMVPSASAITAKDFPAARPEKHVVDSAAVLSRVSSSQLESRLDQIGKGQLDARLITLRKLDYGLSLANFGNSLIERWSLSTNHEDLPLLLMVIDAQNKQAVVVADSALSAQLPESLLQSTGRTTMNKPLVEGERYQQASFDALSRLEVVLDGGDDPGPPIQSFSPIKQTNIPTHEETQSSNALVWVVVLMVVGSIVPMATWWIFSR